MYCEVLTEMAAYNTSNSVRFPVLELEFVTFVM